MLFILPISCIRTLKTLSLVSGPASMIQIVAISVTLYLLLLPEESKYDSNMSFQSNSTHQNKILYRSSNEINNHDKLHDDHVKIGNLARSFGSALFAFEGIGIVIPIYNRMKNPRQMNSLFGLLNVSYAILLTFYMLIGIAGYLKYGDDAKGSISQNLKHGELLSDAVRISFVITILMSYPIQLYPLNELVWKWLRKSVVDNMSSKDREERNNNYEYICRAILVMSTFFIAFTIKELRLLMELFGAITGSTLALIFPVIIHGTAYWNEVKGKDKAVLVIISLFILLFGIIGGCIGTFYSLKTIYDKWDVSMFDAISKEYKQL